MADTENKLTLALRILRKFIEGEAVTDDEIFDAFPGLRESEDERIRKALVKHFQEKKNCVGDTWAGMKVDDVLAYLERQKEQKPAEWSEEDEKIITNACEQLNCYANSYHHGGNYTRAKEVYEVADKLKSLRPQPHWKPSGEQMTWLKCAVDATQGEAHEPLLSLYYKLLDLK